MIGSMYWDAVYVDAGWGLHHLVRNVVGAVKSGLTAGARYFNWMLKGVIIPKGVTIEHIWTAYGTGTSVSCAIAPTSSTNSYLLAILTSSGTAATASSFLFGGSGMSVIQSFVGVGLVYAAGLINPSTTAGNLTATLSGSVAWRIVVFQLSGVNQSTPLVDSQENNSVGGTLASVTLTTVPFGFTVDGVYNQGGYAMTEQNGQTVISVNTHKCSGYLTSPAVSQVHSYAWSTSCRWGIVGLSFNPA